MNDEIGKIIECCLQHNSIYVVINMAQLKEIKSRLQSVKSTQKITTAMMMVASAKLRKTQNIIQNLYPYEEKLSQLLNMFLGQEEFHHFY